ncbi:MAG: hypothetical protein IJ262_03745 [Clostridia bacterium]|nr:hypothetical protein [Clostridia bacterium]
MNYGNTAKTISPSKLSEDIVIMSKIREIVARGNNAEIKIRKDGTLTVMEVKKQIIK